MGDYTSTFYEKDAKVAEELLARLRELNENELIRLADFLRKMIITVVSHNGGHLASNLGVVELTIALHRAFQSPRDKIIWDVGHQTYAHKLLTGRAKEFATLRQYQGLSGFPKRSESPHDVYETGHSSTSISAALGMALARDLRSENHHIAAVIGDGALTGGLAFEAMNHAGQSATRLIVILNDNDMSISANVGSIAKHLNELRVQPSYFWAKNEVKSLLQKLPYEGERIIDLIQRIKISAKHLVLPGLIFEELGFTYLGPVDGHDFAALEFILQQAKKATTPVLLHVLTRKGMGYTPAELSPTRFHGISPFDSATGRTISATKSSFTQVFAETMLDLAAEDPRIVAVTAAMPEGTGLASFAERYPRRFFDVGIAEEHAVTLAAGLATGGARPIVAIYSSFLQRAFDQLVVDVALQNLPVVFAVDRAGIVGEDGASHHGIFDLSYLRLIPGLRVLAPKDYHELRGMLRLSFMEDIPTAIRYPRSEGVEGLPANLNRQNLLDLTQSEIMRPGEASWILAVGPLAILATEVSDNLRQEGYTLGVVNLRSINPLDEVTLGHVLKNGRKIITLEENTLTGGVGSSIMELCQKNNVICHIKTLGLPSAFLHQGERTELLAASKLDLHSVTEAVLTFLRSGLE